MNLYKIKVRYFGPKNSYKGTAGYVAKRNDDEVYDYIDKNLMHRIWGYRSKEIGSPFVMSWECHTGAEDNVEYETYKDYILKFKGDLLEMEDQDAYYYGVTRYGWELVKEVSDEQIEVLKDLGVVE